MGQPAAGKGSPSPATRPASPSPARKRKAETVSAPSDADRPGVQTRKRTRENPGPPRLPLLTLPSSIATCHQRANDLPFRETVTAAQTKGNEENRQAETRRTVQQDLGDDALSCGDGKHTVTCTARPLQNGTSCPRNNPSMLTSTKAKKVYIPSYVLAGQKCVVCGDISTGMHYRALTCEGCKGFFRRTIQNKGATPQFECRNDDACVVTVETRNKCNACRFRNCVAARMDHTSVLSNEKRQELRTLITNNRTQRKSEEERKLTPEMLDMLKEMVDAFRSPYVSSFYRCPPCSDNWQPAWSPGRPGPLSPGVLHSLQFVKSLPGIDQVHPDDLLALANANMPDLLLVQMPQLWDGATDELVFQNGRLGAECLSAGDGSPDYRARIEQHVGEAFRSHFQQDGLGECPENNNNGPGDLKRGPTRRFSADHVFQQCRELRDPKRAQDLQQIMEEEREEAEELYRVERRKQKALLRQVQNEQHLNKHKEKELQWCEAWQPVCHFIQEYGTLEQQKKAQNKRQQDLIDHLGHERYDNFLDQKLPEQKRCNQQQQQQQQQQQSHSQNPDELQQKSHQQPEQDIVVDRKQPQENLYHGQPTRSDHLKDATGPPPPEEADYQRGPNVNEKEHAPKTSDVRRWLFELGKAYGQFVVHDLIPFACIAGLRFYNTDKLALKDPATVDKNATTILEALTRYLLNTPAPKVRLHQLIDKLSIIETLKNECKGRVAHICGLFRTITTEDWDAIFSPRDVTAKQPGPSGLVDSEPREQVSPPVTASVSPHPAEYNEQVSSPEALDLSIAKNYSQPEVRIHHSETSDSRCSYEVPVDPFFNLTPAHIARVHRPRSPQHTECYETFHSSQHPVTPMMRSRLSPRFSPHPNMTPSCNWHPELIYENPGPSYVIPMHTTNSPYSQRLETISPFHSRQETSVDSGPLFQRRMLEDPTFYQAPIPHENQTAFAHLDPATSGWHSALCPRLNNGTYSNSSAFPEAQVYVYSGPYPNISTRDNSTQTSDAEINEDRAPDSSRSIPRSRRGRTPPNHVSSFPAQQSDRAAILNVYQSGDSSETSRPVAVSTPGPSESDAGTGSKQSLKKRWLAQFFPENPSSSSNN